MAHLPGGFKSGFAAVVGRPNTGKSTLVNALVGEKVAITSPVPQTTRSAIRGIVNRPEAQIVLIDTPGYHKPRTLLGERLNEVARAAWSDVDAAVLVVDARDGIGRGDERVAADLRTVDGPVICAVNKVDHMKGGDVLTALERAARLGDFAEFVPTSGRTGEGTNVLCELLLAALPEGPMYYPPTSSTDQPPPLFVAELVREKLLDRMREEVPHSIAVVTDDFEERSDGLLEIHATIYVERKSQKGIVIGAAGATIKQAGTEVREEVETLFGRKVFIELRVRVEQDWQRRAQSLTRLGFGS